MFVVVTILHIFLKEISGGKYIAHTFKVVRGGIYIAYIFKGIPRW